MDLSNPLRVVTPTLDADVLRVLAPADKAFTGREVHRAVGTASYDGVRLALARLVRQGIVESERAGSAQLYRLNRDHLAAPHVVALATLRLELIASLREEIAGWLIAPILAALFGSVARGDADESSDIDVLVVRPRRTSEDDSTWRAQIATFESKASISTGNDTRTLEYAFADFVAGRQAERVLRDAERDAIVLFGSFSVTGNA